MENELHALRQALSRLRRDRTGISDRWDSSGGTNRDNYLTYYHPSGGAQSPQFCFTSGMPWIWTLALDHHARQYRDGNKAPLPRHAGCFKHWDNSFPLVYK